MTCEGGFAGRGFAKNVPRRVLQVEIVTAHVWTPMISSDGVPSFVAQLRPRALQEVVP
jgi:hypothetical protein